MSDSDDLNLHLGLNTIIIENDIENNLFNSDDNVELTLYNNSTIISNFTRIVINYYNHNYNHNFFPAVIDNDDDARISDNISVIENSSFTCTNDSDSSPEEIEVDYMLNNTDVHDAPKPISYTKLSYASVEKGIEKYYFNINHRISSSLDIIASSKKLVYGIQILRRNAIKCSYVSSHCSFLYCYCY